MENNNSENEVDDFDQESGKNEANPVSRTLSLINNIPIIAKGKFMKIPVFDKWHPNNYGCSNGAKFSLFCYIYSVSSYLYSVNLYIQSDLCIQSDLIYIYIYIYQSHIFSHLLCVMLAKSLKSVLFWRKQYARFFLIRKPFFCLSLNFLNIMLEIRLRFS